MNVPWFLPDFIDPEWHRFEVLGDTVIVNGVLRGPEARCTYIIHVLPRRYQLELDMYVDELVGLEIRLERFDRDARQMPRHAALWIDDAIMEAWNASVAEDDRLAIRGGNCTFAGDIVTQHRSRLEGIVGVMTAIASVPARRARELASRVEHLGVRSQPDRLRAGGDGIVLHDDVVIAVDRDAETRVSAGEIVVACPDWADLPDAVDQIRRQREHISSPYR